MKKPVTTKVPAEQVVKEIRRATRKLHSSEEKIRIVLAGRSRMAPITRWLLPRLCSEKIMPRSSLLRCLLRLSIATSYALWAVGVALET